MAARDSTLLLEVDAPGGIHPDTVDTRVAVDLAGAFVELFDKAAAQKGVALRLRGFEVVDKCFQLRIDTGNPEFAIMAAAELDRLLRSREVPADKALAKATRRFRRALADLGDDIEAKVAVGDWTRVLEPEEPAPLHGAESITSLRARLVRIGVAPARAKFESGSEDEPFVVKVSTGQAEAFAAQLNKEVDITIRVKRDATGHITDGELIELHPLDEDDAEAWLRWLSENGRDWDNVPDHLKELGRLDD